LGPVALTFAGIVKFEQIDGQAYTARVAAQGTDAKGRGGANAASVFRIEPAGGGPQGLGHHKLAPPRPVGPHRRRLGIIQAMAAQLMNQFATRLKEQLAQERSPAPVPGATQPSPTQPSPPTAANAGPTATAKPISGFALLAKALWSWIISLFKRS